MPSSKSASGRGRATDGDPAVDVARRRLAALAAELAVARGEPAPEPPTESPVEPLADSLVARTDRSVAPSQSGRHARRPVTPLGRGAGWLSDRMPMLLHERPHFGAAQVGLVCLVLSAGILAGAWFLVKSGGAGNAGDVVAPRPVITATPSPTTSPGSTTSGPAAVGATSESADQMVVDVVGKVRRPGIVVLPAGSRVVDAVRAAGGFRRGVDRTQVNLARPLTDGEQLVVGVGAVPGSAALPSAGASPAEGVLVNLNTADQATLETLPEVGPVTAAAILEWRAEHGAFTAVEELLEVSGIGDATLRA